MNELLQTIIAKIKQLLNSSPAPVVQATANKPAASTEPKKEPSPIAVPINKPVSATKPELIIKPKTIKIECTNDNLPQDSTLRRHAIAHIRSLIESINPARPTDSSLSRHYDALINAEIEQCISDKGAIERLIVTVEAHKKALPQSVTAPIKPVVKAKVSAKQTTVQAEAPVLEQPAINTEVKANIPLPPTDSTLRRHYDTMIDYELNSLLEGK